MGEQTFSKGDRVLVKATSTDGTVYKIEGEGANRRYWVDYGLTAQSVVPGRPITFEQPDADGAFNPSGPYTAEELRPWY